MLGLIGFGGAGLSTYALTDPYQEEGGPKAFDLRLSRVIWIMEFS